ncbi:MAG: hypothetical protein ABSA05_03060 [Opitutaceae bacterium]
MPVRFAPDERTRLYDQAKATGLSLSALVRAAALALEVKPRRPVLDTELLHLLASASNNLNQIAHGLNAARQRSFSQIDWPQLEASLKAAAGSLNDLAERTRYDR